MINEDFLSRMQALNQRFEGFHTRVGLTREHLEHLHSVLPELSPDLGELDLLRHKAFWQKKRELGEDFLEAAAILRKMCDLMDPELDGLMDEAKKVGRP
jgi:hypothetical protein